MTESSKFTKTAGEFFNKPSTKYVEFNKQIFTNTEKIAEFKVSCIFTAQQWCVSRSYITLLQAWKCSRSYHDIQLNVLLTRTLLIQMCMSLYCIRVLVISETRCLIGSFVLPVSRRKWLVLCVVGAAGFMVWAHRAVLELEHGVHWSHF